MRIGVSIVFKKRLSCWSMPSKSHPSAAAPAIAPHGVPQHYADGAPCYSLLGRLPQRQGAPARLPLRQIHCARLCVSDLLQQPLDRHLRLAAISPAVGDMGSLGYSDWEKWETASRCTLRQHVEYRPLKTKIKRLNGSLYSRKNVYFTSCVRF